MGLSGREDSLTIGWAILTQNQVTNVWRTDRQTDRRTDWRPAYSYNVRQSSDAR